MSTRGGAIPLCDLQGQYRALRSEIEARVCQVLASCQVIQGPEVAGFEQEVASYCGVAHGVGCASGSDALLLALAALDIGPGDEVILPTFTFFATAGAVARLGAKPVFVDSDPETWNLDPRLVERVVTPRTRAIIPVHLFGQSADMEPISAIAAAHGLAVIEDAAQSLGSEYQGRKTGSLGHMACLSFYPSKNLGAYGDAGMVLTSDPDLAEKLACLRIHGMPVRYQHKYLGWNARLDAIHAAMLRVKLPHLDRWIESRRAAALRYDALIERYQLGNFFAAPAVRPDLKHSFNQYVVRVAGGQRDALMRHLKAEQIGCEVYYPIPLHLQESLGYLGHREGSFPVSEAASRSVLALPMFPELTQDQQERVMASCAAFARQGSRMAA